MISLENFASTSNYSEETSHKWSAMEAAGAVCLPAASSHADSNVNDVGYYWSSAANEFTYAYGVYFDCSNVSPDSENGRSCGSSVRLITECQ